MTGSSSESRKGDGRIVGRHVGGGPDLNMPDGEVADAADSG